MKQKKRAMNQVWAAAENYGFDPPFLAYRPDGSPDLYRNIVIGLAAKYFDREKLEKFFLSYAESVRRDAFDGIVWLGIENSVYEKELPHRPVLKELRKACAEEYFAAQKSMNRQQWMAKNKRILDEENYRWAGVSGRRLPILTPRRKKLAEELMIGADADTDALIGRLDGILRRYFHWGGGRESGAIHFHFSARTAAVLENLFHRRMEREQHLELRSDRGQKGTVTVAGRNDAPAETGGREKEQSDRAYIEACFGRSILRERERTDMERELCRGLHEGCHLWITDGVRHVRPAGRERGASRQEISRNLESRRIADAAARQQTLNRNFVTENEELIQSTAKRLSAKLSAELEDLSAPYPAVSRSGRLDGRRVWRLPVLRDSGVFRKEEREQQPDLSVEILLDASASRMDMQENVAAQGYVLAESFRLAGISCSVTAFRSVRGFTVLQILKRREERDSARILNYFAAGWNRDGLALRAAAEEPCFPAQGAVRGEAARRILLILTDAGPNDSTGIPEAGGILHFPYEGRAAVEDARRAVLENEARGILTAAIFLGPTMNLKDAERIYGRNIARIHRIDQMADAAGRLLPELLRRAL